MKSKDVKKALIEKFNRRVRTRTIPGSDIIEAWIPWDVRSAVTEFPLALRVAALKLEYGYSEPGNTDEPPSWITLGVAGNVGLHGITLRAPNWERLLAVENIA